ncbi:MAG: UDP-N-acetylglucosamine--N-acetylmuramyl-(pentapeptide) pyrophosphoryl-undecaprenol N-acetylglucosamine transferase [Gemmatimonadota bacterium]|nr:UDP-N-acetylglucosamine--N-acetylmuramyl-(pentapeptide) pyrophosphoryl-undecaprenol N-acetylglucosamine transferase [Gemmatimonadota bacterium]
MRVLFAGGGSGGHLYPALAIARALVERDSRVQPFFVGARRGIERNILPETEFPFELLDLHPLYRSRPWLNWRTVVGSARSWRRISAIVARDRPCVLVATGGYAAGVALSVARWRGVPIVIQEQNSVPGLTVRLYARRAAQIHLGFPEAAGQLSLGRGTRIYDSGNPIAPPLPLELRPPREASEARWGFRSDAAPIVLVFGGSQGAEGINRIVAKWVERGPGQVRVIWATGPANFDRYSHLDSADVRVLPYIQRVAEAYSAADFAVSRAGAMTTAELSAWGIPTILVPLPTAAADHQRQNARAIAASGAAVMIEQPALSPELLGATVERLATDSGLRAAMRDKNLERARPDAAQQIATDILSMDCFK